MTQARTFTQWHDDAAHDVMTRALTSALQQSLVEFAIVFIVFVTVLHRIKVSSTINVLLQLRCNYRTLARKPVTTARKLATDAGILADL